MKSPRVAEVAHTLRRLTRRFGIEVMRYPAVNSLEGHLRHMLKSQRIDCVLDVGALRGEYAEGLIAGGFRGSIHSFEPTPDSFSKLQVRAERYENWSCRNVAVGIREEFLEINVARGRDFASFRTPTAFALERFPGGPEAEARACVRVERLDSFFDGNPEFSSARMLLKTDTQGWDLDVLRGCGAWLSKIRLIQIELSVIPVYAGAPSYLEVLEFLASQGFMPTGFFPVSRNASDRSVIEFDGVLVNRN